MTGLIKTATVPFRAFGTWRMKTALLWVAGMAVGALHFGACTSPPVRPALGAFTGDERELSYLDRVRRVYPTALQTPESVHTALSFYRDMKFQQQALFVRFQRQYPQATPQEMARLVQDALPRQTHADLPNIPPPPFQCFNVNAGKIQSISCN